jgi:hypothetical protein
MADGPDQARRLFDGTGSGMMMMFKLNLKKIVNIQSLHALFIGLLLI